MKSPAPSSRVKVVAYVGFASLGLALVVLAVVSWNQFTKNPLDSLTYEDLRLDWPAAPAVKQPSLPLRTSDWRQREGRDRLDRPDVR